MNVRLAVSVVVMLTVKMVRIYLYAISTTTNNFVCQPIVGIVQLHVCRICDMYIKLPAFLQFDTIQYQPII